ncbi:ABC transporter permease [Methanobacterium ferruginis]|jgi:ABC-2 type transport system permease protein|uniref:ABC transporter permease n=1 Tax=Methanobacterium ferruginis TaxID=710191 RepID=UPI002573E9E8|nr:ABC transporter permease [Methanobacterium ferruginis]BDZ67688.1 ABC transporter permease [Methanobacterium ferruginis]
MKFYRVMAVSRKVFRDVANDKRSLAMLFLAPIFAMCVFGLAFSGDVEDVNVIIVNQDQGYTSPMGDTTYLSETIISNLDTKVLNIKNMSNVDEARQQVIDGKASAVIIFPENFTQNALLKTQDPSYPDSAEIIIQGDDSITNIKNSILQTVNQALSDTMTAEGVEPALKITSDPIYGKDAEFIDFFVPGILAFVVYLLTTILTLITFVGERVNGTLERVLASPVTEGEVITGYALTFGVLGVVQVALLLAVAILAFNIIVVGNVLLAFLAVAILAISCQALGILLSSLAKRPEQAIQFFPFVILPAFLLSGVFWPIQAIPAWLRPFSYLVPPTYAADACRAVMLKGWGLTKIWPDLLALVIFALLFLGLAVWSLKRGKN